MSLFYTGGMFLNDAFDHGFDAKVRPERPIPSGQVSAAQVHAFGFAMMAVGLFLLGWVGYHYEPLTQWRPVAAGRSATAHFGRVIGRRCSPVWGTLTRYAGIYRS